MALPLQRAEGKIAGAEVDVTTPSANADGFLGQAQALGKHLDFTQFPDFSNIMSSTPLTNPQKVCNNGG